MRTWVALHGQRPQVLAGLWALVVGAAWVVVAFPLEASFAAEQKDSAV
jgi:hypothetical protein